MSRALVATVVCASFFGFCQGALAATEISESINKDTTWTLAGSPYLITDYISVGAISTSTLTIEPGVIVKFEPDTRLSIFGSLIAEGTEAEPIYFTSARNDDIGGDTNEDGTDTTPSSSDDWAINVFDSPESRLAHVELSYLRSFAGHQSVFTIEHLSMQNCARDLMFFDGAVSGADILVSGADILVDGSASAAFSNIEIDGGNFMAFDVADLSVHDATISASGFGMGLIVDNMFDPEGTVAHLEGISVSNAHVGIYDVGELTLHGMHVTYSGFSSALTIDGTYAPTGTTASITDVTLSGGGMSLDYLTATLDGVEITDPSYTPGIEVSNSTLGLTNAEVTDVEAPALTASYTSMTVTDSQFIGGSSVGVSLSGEGDVEMRRVEIRDFPNAPGLVISSEKFVGERLKITNTGHGVQGSGDIRISQSLIRDNTSPNSVHGVTVYEDEFDEEGTTILPDLRHNYWGDPSGPTHEANPDGLGDTLTGDALFDPWLSSFCEVDCHSNIMFLPGIMGSRLYEDGERLWEAGNDELARLHLDETGVSVSDHIVTKDVIDSYDGALNVDIYNAFLEDLAEAKGSGTINDYSAVPYDWRLSLSQILSSGIKDVDGNISYLSDTDTPYIESELRRLAASSKNGRVSIVAHSNGGLLAKALINILGEEASELIEQVILVAVPQLGTPRAIGSLLHGYELGIPGSVSDEAGRAFVQNAPVAYQLLPFHDYYEGPGHITATPYVTFTQGAATQSFIDTYGYALTADELTGFLIGIDGRTQPAYEDTYLPTNVNQSLLISALAAQLHIDSSWQPPDGIKVHQIAGVGEITLANINYKTIQKCQERSLFRCTLYEDLLSYDLNEVIDGDGTVVTPSALAMSDDSENVDRWWVDLQKYNRDNLNIGPYRQNHASILEVEEVRRLILNNLVRHASDALPDYTFSATPPLESEDRLVFALHSPLALSAVDADGNVVSEYENTIPKASFVRYGEVQKLFIPTGIPFTLVLTGEADGSFTLDIVEYDEEEIVATTTFSAIPSLASTVAEMEFTEGRLEDASALRIDLDGDSSIDVAYTPIVGESITAPDETPITQPARSGSGSTSTRLPQELGVGLSNDEIEYIRTLLPQLVHIISAAAQLKGVIPATQYDELLQHVITMLQALEVLVTRSKVSGNEYN